MKYDLDFDQEERPVKKMDPKIKKLWVAALRSGQYDQARGQLRKVTNPRKVHEGSSFCCLGVLCNLHAQLHPEIAAKQKTPGSYMGQNQYLPRQVATWARIDIEGSYVLIDNRRASLSSHNDNEKSFDKIADAIEAQL